MVVALVAAGILAGIAGLGIGSAAEKEKRLKDKDAQIAQQQAQIQSQQEQQNKERELAAQQAQDRERTAQLEAILNAQKAQQEAQAQREAQESQREQQMMFMLMMNQYNKQSPLAWGGLTIPQTNIYNYSANNSLSLNNNIGLQPAYAANSIANNGFISPYAPGIGAVRAA